MSVSKSIYSFGGPPKPEKSFALSSYLGVFGYSHRALSLVWRTSKGLTLAIGAGSLLAGILPAAIAYIGKRLVDTIILAAKTGADIDTC